MKRILIVDDDIHIGDMLGEVLEREGYGVMRAYSGTEAQLLLASLSRKPDLVLLDLMLPGLSGEALLPTLYEIPTIVLSAKTSQEGKVRLLREGAVDYVTKPFDIRELLARIEVALRTTAGRTSALSFELLTLNTDTYTAQAGEKTLHLTRTEFAILRQLMLHSTQVLSKSQLLDAIAADTPDCTESSLKIHVSNLRRKLRQACGKDYIEAVWGIGFRLKKD